MIKSVHNFSLNISLLSKARGIHAMYDYIVIPDHAISRFQERLKCVNGKEASDSEKTIRKLLAKAKEEQVDPLHRVKRLLKHGCEEATYLVSSG